VADISPIRLVNKLYDGGHTIKVFTDAVPAAAKIGGILPFSNWMAGV